MITDLNNDKYINTPEFNKLTTENFKARLAQEDLVTKTDFYVKLKEISKKITSNKTRYLLVENELKKLKIFDLSYFRRWYSKLFSISASGENVLKELQVLVVVIIYIFENLKVCLMKGLILILHLIIVLLQN